jgi:hypothetical protein
MSHNAVAMNTRTGRLRWTFKGETWTARYMDTIEGMYELAGTTLLFNGDHAPFFSSVDEVGEIYEAIIAQQIEK